MKNVMIMNGTPKVRDKHAVWTILDRLKPDCVITRNQNGVDQFAYAWAMTHQVRAVRMPLSSMVKHLVQQRPEVVLDFGAGRDRVAYDFLKVARGAIDCQVIPISY